MDRRYNSTFPIDTAGGTRARHESDSHHRRRLARSARAVSRDCGRSPHTGSGPRDAIQLARAGPDRRPFARSVCRQRGPVARGVVARRGAGGCRRSPPGSGGSAGRDRSVCSARPGSRRIALMRTLSSHASRECSMSCFSTRPFVAGGSASCCRRTAFDLRRRIASYLEAHRKIAGAPEGLTVWRRDRAGQVHYHLMRRTMGA